MGAFDHQTGNGFVRERRLVVFNAGGDGTSLRPGTGALRPNSYGFSASFPKIWFASSNVSFEPMSNHSPGTRQV